MVKTLLPSEQAMSLGVQVGDMITSVGNIRVPSGPTGLAFVTKAMKTQKRPVRVVCARADDGPMHTLKLTFEAGGLSWVLGRDRGMHCHVVAVRSGKKAGQASHLGARKGDRIVKVGASDVPKSFEALQIVNELVASQPRPVDIVLKRQGLKPDAEEVAVQKKTRGGLAESGRAESKDAFAIRVGGSHGPLYCLSELPMENMVDFDMEWKTVKAYAKSGVKYTKPVKGNGSEVKSHGTKENVKNGLHALDTLVGIGSTDVSEEQHDRIQLLLAAYLEDSRKRGVIKLRFRHHGAKFEKLRPEPRSLEYDVLFKHHPLDDGLDITQHFGTTVVLAAHEGSYAAKKGIKPGDSLIGMEGVSVKGIPFANVDHMVHFVDPPVTMRFAKLRQKGLREITPAEKRAGQIDVKVNRSDVLAKRVAFDWSGDGPIHVVANATTKIAKAMTFIAAQKIGIGWQLLGVDGVDVQEDLHTYALHVLMEAANQNKGRGHLVLRFGPEAPEGDRAFGETKHQGKKTRGGRRRNINQGGGQDDVSKMMQLKKKFSRGKLPRISKADKLSLYDIELQGSAGLELCKAPPPENWNGRSKVLGSVVSAYKGISIDKNDKKGKASLKKLACGDLVVAVDGMNVSKGTHEEINFLLHTHKDRKKRLRLRHFVLEPLGKAGRNEVDITLTYNQVQQLEWTNHQSNYECDIQNEVPPSHPLSREGVVRGSRLVGVEGKDVTTLPFVGVTDWLAKVEADKKPHNLRFRRVS